MMFGDPGAYTSVFASLLGVAAGAYLALSGLIKTVHEQREKRLLEQIDVESDEKADLRRDLVAMRGLIMDMRVLTGRMLGYVRIDHAAPSEELQSIEGELARIDETLALKGKRV